MNWRTNRPPNRSWLFNYTSPITGKSRTMGLGPFPDVSLKLARELAERGRAVVRDERDPLAERDQAKVEAAAREAAAKQAKITFSAVVAKYLRDHEKAWRNAVHRMQWENTLATYVEPLIGAKPVAEISTADLKAILDPIWTVKPETASRVRGRIEAILTYAKAMGWFSGENPAVWRGHLQALLPPKSKVRKVKHHAAMDWRELPAFMAELRARPEIAARLLEFVILTCARTGEAIGARWPEIDHHVWRVPGERMKAGREHRVPLSDAAVDVLDRTPRLANAAGQLSPWLFPGAVVGNHLSNMAGLMLLRRMGRPELTVHGFRSSFRDWASEATAHAPHAAEAALAHAVGDKVEAAYRRGDLFAKRIALMADWGNYCSLPRGAVVALIRQGSGA